MNLGNIILSEIIQTQRATYCMTSLIQNVQNRQIRRDKSMLVIPRGWGRGVGRDC